MRVGGRARHGWGVGLVGRGAVGALEGGGPALAAVGAAVIIVQGGGRSPGGAAQRGAGVAQHRGALAIAHQTDPHQVVPGTPIGRGRWAPGDGAAGPIWIASIVG